jgi:hypothetical protein
MFADEIRKASELYSNCKNGKYSFVNTTEWLISFQGHEEGMKMGYSLGVIAAIELVKRECPYLQNGEELSKWIEEKLL